MTWAGSILNNTYNATEITRLGGEGQLSKNKTRVAVLERFGTAIANMVAANDFPVTLWMRSQEKATGFTCERNADYLPGYKLSQSLEITSVTVPQLPMLMRYFLLSPAAPTER